MEIKLLPLRIRIRKSLFLVFFQVLFFQTFFAFATLSESTIQKQERIVTGKITVPAASNMVVSYIGYKTKIIVINNRTTINVQLDADTSQLEEVMVVGYGSLSKKRVTGAIVSIKAESFKDIPVSSVEQSLASQLLGVEIAQNPGQPGAANKDRCKDRSYNLSLKIILYD